MEIGFQSAKQWKSDVVMEFIWKGEQHQGMSSDLCDRTPWMFQSLGWQDFSGKAGELAFLYGEGNIPRLLLLGLGSSDELLFRDFRLYFAQGLLECRKKNLRHVAVDMHTVTRLASFFSLSREALARELVVAAYQALYRFDQYKSEKQNQNPQSFSFLLEEDSCLDSLKKAVGMAEAEGSGICYARDLANTPPSRLNPAAFAQEAAQVASQHGMRFQTLGKKELAEEGMEALLAVGAGSAQEPCMSILEYIPEGTSGLSPIVLVGKGITFDSGGLSLKNSGKMMVQKGDMSGAGAILGVFEALGRLSSLGIVPQRPVIGIMPCAENMPSGTATKPGDVVWAKNGKSIEIVDTDAEGRLVLADALAYADIHYHPALLVDIATLTGACITSLGEGSAGLYSNDEWLGEFLFKAGNSLSERNWRLPLWPDMLEGLKSPVADIKNLGPSEGGSLRAAVFLMQFISKKIRWAHIDMAPSKFAHTSLNPEGFTGFGVRTLLSAALIQELA